MSLVASACASSEPTTEASSAVSEDVADSNGSDSAPGSADESEAASSDDGSAEGPDNTAEDDGAADEGGESAPADEIPNVFPDLTTTNIVDGSTVNLADQLAGGDTPVLLWFFAPH